MVCSVRSTLLGIAVLFSSALGARAEDASPPSGGPQPPAGIPAVEPPAPAGPEGPAVPKDLESLLALAMRGNPEILVAEAKVAQAEAEAHAARLRVSHAVLEARAEQAEAVRRRAAAEKSASMIQARVIAGHVSTEEGDRASEAFAEAKAAVAEVEARLRYLCGTGTSESREQGVVTDADGRPVEGALRAGLYELAVAGRKKAAFVQLPLLTAPAARVAETNMLDRPVAIGAYQGVPLQTVLDQIRATTGILILIDRQEFPEDSQKELLSQTLTLDLRKPLPLRAVLDAVTDSLEWPVMFVPRQYGALLTRRPR